MHNFFILLILLFTSLSCSIYHIDSKETSSDFYPSKRNPKDVVYLEKIVEPHEIIGIVTVNTERNQGISEVIDRMKYEAAILGGDAITSIETDATGDWKKLPAQNLIGNAFVRANFTAKVVIFK